MGKITRFEYLGGWRGWTWIVFCCITVVFIPLAILHAFENIVIIEEQMDNPNEFMEAFRQQPLRKS